jgi:hypothetical protein
MKLVLSLALSLLTPPAFASPASTAALVTTAKRLVVSANADVGFLRTHVANCTRFAATIQERMVEPIAKDLGAFQLRLARYRNTPPQSCGSRADLDFMLATINDKLAKAGSAQSGLMGMSGDEAMTKALSADDSGSYPNCRPDDPRDFKSTPELKAYFALKLKLVALKASLATLKNRTDCEKREDYSE